jgi:type II secretion system protein C
MARYLSWLANAALLALCCFFVAQTANTVLATLVVPDPVDETPAPPPTPVAERSWNERQVILTRNLFNASLLAPAPEPVIEEEDLEATQLPLQLLGTVASPSPLLTWAAIQDKESRKHVVVHLDDPLQGGKAKVVRIEPKRIVLEENGELRELALLEVAPAAPAPPARRGAQAARRPRPRKRVAQSPAAVRAAQAKAAQARAQAAPQTQGRRSAIFSQARVLPKYEEGAMVGMEVSSIQSGSLWEELGIEEGDLITELNGIAIDSPGQSSKLLSEFAGSAEFTVTVEGAAGTETINVTLPQE